MDKRFAGFIAVAFAILLLNTIIGQLVRGPQPLEPRAQQPDRQVAEPSEAVETSGTEDEPAESPDDAVASVQSPAAEAKPEQPVADEPAVAVPPTWVTLGSVDPTSPYRLLVTLNNQGAVVERLELASPRYRDLEDRSGYLGHLSPARTPTGKGVQVRTVGAGTPAAVAGVQVGDVLLQIDDAPVTEPEELRRLLQATKPGQTVQLMVARGDSPPATRSCQLGRRPLEVMRPEVENIHARRLEKLLPGFEDPASFRLTLQQIGDQVLEGKAGELAGVDLYDAPWEVVQQSDSAVEFRRVLSGLGLTVVKRYSLAQVPADRQDDPNYPAYHVDLDIEIRNQANQARAVAYRLDGPTGLPVEGWWYANKIGREWFQSVGLRDLNVQVQDQEPTVFGAADMVGDQVPTIGNDQSFMFVGMDSQYFAAVLLPLKQRLDEVWIADLEPLVVGEPPGQDEDARLANVTCRLLSKPQTLAADQGVFRHTYRVFTGPKVPALLTEYRQPEDASYHLGELIYYGWFGWVAKAMLALLHLFYSVVGNYGLAIIMLTVLVRGMMFPLSKKQALNMAKMQELQPELKRIQEKYKDLQKRSQAQQELYRKHKFNPMGGCMVMFVQLPVFIGLYRSLMVDVELRQAPLLGDAIRWCSNLSAPDMLFDWSSLMPDYINHGYGLLALGPYLNILPLITVVLFLAQQKMFMPPPADEQAAMQQKVMTYMMLFIGILFYKVASGLCLYFIASSVWGIAERKLLPKPPARNAAPTADPKPAPESGGNNGKSKTKSQKSKSKQKRR